MGFEGGSEGEKSADSLVERRGRGGGDFVKTSPDATATEEAEAEAFVCRPFSPLAGGATA